MEEGAAALWAHPGPCPRVKDVSTLFREDPQVSEESLEERFFQVTFQEHLLKERSVGHHLGSAHPYNQPLLSRRGMHWTGAQQAFSSRSVTQHLLPRLLGYSEPHVLKHCAPRYCGHSSLLTTFFKVDCHSVTSSSPTFSNHMDCSMPGFPVLQCFLKFAQTHVH